ncbi:hypothetical protein [Sphingomonas quercus]|uniref:PH domain-containing protein n=1 Tax=Sphingomonas quercus TaxID=2842451 RepID=A0ABS6BJF7_9SPHN|nr:hypothetical protein [Sphingomonas quercus]MBU3077752.1 hypothetical protein [Sphingomonas quercus]
MSDPVAAVPASPKAYPEALDCVQKTEKMMQVVPGLVVLVLVGLPVLSELAHLRVSSAITIGVIMLIIAGFVAKGVTRFILSPIRTTRYKAVANQLAEGVRAIPASVSQWRCWWEGAPGALAVTQAGDLVIVDRSTNYEELWLRPSQLAHISVEREAVQITNTKHGGRFTLGGASRGGLFGGYTFGGKSRSVTHMQETAFLEIRYQLERNGMTYTSVIPFGADRRGADALCATLVRLEQG